MSAQLLQDVYYNVKSNHPEFFTLLFPLSKSKICPRTCKDVEIMRRNIFHVVSNLYIFCMKDVEGPRCTSSLKPIKDIWPFDFCLWHLYGQDIKSPGFIIAVPEDVL